MTDSPWASVAATAKTFRLSFDYVLYEMSYANCVLYSASLPSYSPKKDEDKRAKKAIRADKRENLGKVEEFFNNVKD